VIRVKVCCIGSEEEARLAVTHGVAAIGLVSAMPSGPGPIPEGRIAEIARTVPPGVTTFLLTSSTDAEAIADQHRRLGTQVLQLVDRVEESELRRLRSRVPAAGIVPVIHVSGPAALEEAKAMAEHADALLLDSGRPDAAVKELGGTGRTHDWEVSARIRQEVDLPVFLAGGLDADNVARAIRTVRPYGVDVCSGLRAEGTLESGRLEAFMSAVQAA